MFRSTIQAAGSVQYLDLNLLSYNSKSALLSTAVSIYPAWTMQMSPDGTKMFIMEFERRLVRYDLSTPFDISTASANPVSVYEVSEPNISGFIAMSSDGTKLIVGDRNNNLYSYTLSTAWDITTTTYSSTSNIPGQQVNQINEIAVSEDGTKVYVGDNNGNPDGIFQYNLSTAWDVSTASYHGFFDISGQIVTVNGLDFKPDGTKMYINDNNPDAVHQYTLTTPGDVTTAVYDNISLDLSALDGNAKSGVYGRTGKDYYFCGYFNDTIYQMEG